MNQNLALKCCGDLNLEQLIRHFVTLTFFTAVDQYLGQELIS
jgi:hypothetical protein